MVGPKFWDNRRGRVKEIAEILQLNTVIENVRIVLLIIISKMQLNGQYITASAIKDAYLENANEELHTLSRLPQITLEQAKLVLQWSTLKHYGVTERYLKRFIQEKKEAGRCILPEINYKFVLDFESFRGHASPDQQKPMNNNGVMKHLPGCVKMTSLAIRLEWLQDDPFQNYKIKHEKGREGFQIAREN